MALHIKCQTPYAVFLLGCKTEDGPLRFPGNSKAVPGLLVEVKNLPINEQLLKAAATVLKDHNLSGVEINQAYRDALVLDNYGDATLYLGTLAVRDSDEITAMPTMPDLIRALPKNKSRLPFLRAWQVLAGGLTEDSKAVDLDEALKHLKKSWLEPESEN